MIRPCTISTLAFVGLLAACGPPTVTDSDTSDTTGGTSSGGDASAGSTTAPGISSDGTSPGGTSPGGTSPGTDDDTASSPTAGGGELVCEWTFVDELDMPRQRGVGAEDQTCNPVTTDTIALEVQLDVPDGHELGPAAAVELLLFEYDPNVADASADCVGGLCGPLEGADPVWMFDVPNDLPELGYYISVDLDDGNGCILHEVDFVTFSPGQGTLVVPMAADCI